MNVAYLLGIICGLAAVAIFCAVLAFRNRHSDPNWGEYDERQQLARNQAYKYAFFTLLAFNSIHAFLVDAAKIVWSETSAAAMIGICLSLCVFACTCIWKEAYLSLTDRPRRLLPILFLGTGVNLLIGVGNLFRYGLLNVSGQIGFHNLNLIAGIMCLIILINFLAWYRRRSSEETEY